MELKLEQPWTQVKEKLKEHHKKLTDEDLFYEKGKEEELISRVSKKIGRPAKEAKEWIESMSFNK